LSSLVERGEEWFTGRSWRRMLFNGKRGAAAVRRNKMTSDF